MDGILEVTALVVFAGFAISGLGYTAAYFMFLGQTFGDPRSMRQRVKAAVHDGEWPHLPSAIWLRRTMRGAVGFWIAGAVTVLAIIIEREF